jgi:hypothetical protein
MGTRPSADEDEGYVRKGGFGLVAVAVGVRPSSDEDRTSIDGNLLSNDVLPSGAAGETVEDEGDVNESLKPAKLR